MSTAVPGRSSESPYTSGVRSDWPASLATESLRKAFLTRLFGDLDEDSAADRKELLRRARPILQPFYRALIQPTGRSRTERWLEQFGPAALPLWRQVWNWETTAAYQTIQDGHYMPDLPGNEDHCYTLLTLFRELLGIAIMRPVVGSLPQHSSVFYASIDHAFLNATAESDETKQLILESVVVPPGRGSVGRCLKEGASRVSISFGDYAGVVEWQDLVQGQVSILMVTRQARGAQDPDVHLALMAFFPVAYVFDDCVPLGQLADVGALTRANNDSDFLQALRACLDDPILRDTAGALTEYQDLLRRNQQFQEAIPKGEETEVNTFAAAVVNLLVPKRFTDLPVPLNAALAIVADPDPSHGDRFEIAHLRVTTQALEEAVEAAAPKVMRDFLTGEGSPQFSGLAPLLLDGASQPLDEYPQLLSFQKPRFEDLLFLPEANEKCEAIWWIHTVGERGWPAGAREYAKLIHKPLSAILKIAKKLAGWGDELLEVDKAWRHTLPLYAEFKLRDNLAEQYYSLISRVLFCESQRETKRRLGELRFLLEICANFQGLPGINLHSDEIDTACENVKRLRDLLTVERDEEGDAFLGLTSFIRLPHRMNFSGSNQEDSWHRLLPMLQIQEKLFPSAGRQTVLLETGQELTLERLSRGYLRARIEGREVLARVQDQFVVKADLHPDRAQRWTSWIVQQIGKGIGSARLEEGLKKYLGTSSTRMKSSLCESKGKLQAELRVSYRDSRQEDDARSSYELKLAPISHLFQVTMRQYYETAAATSQATLAAFARGASHGLKNAITGAELLLGRKPENLGNSLSKMGLAPDDLGRIQDLVQASVAVQHDLNHLKDQAELFFWIMDPERAEYGLATLTGTNPLDRLMTGALLQGFQLAMGRLTAPEMLRALKKAKPGIGAGALEALKDELQESLAACRRTYLEQDNTEGWRDSLPQLRATIDEWLRVDFKWSDSIPACAVDARTARIVAAILVEVFQNAIKAAIKCRQPRVAMVVRWNPEKTGVILDVSNSATKEGIQTVRAVLGPERSLDRYARQVHGMRGLWQLELLCDRLGHGMVHLGDHRFGSDEITIQLLVQSTSP